MQELIEQLKKDEGFAKTPFWDNKQWTWGYGTMAPGGYDKDYYDDRKRPTIDRMSAEVELNDHIKKANLTFQKMFSEVPMNNVRKNAIKLFP